MDKVGFNEKMSAGARILKMEWRPDLEARGNFGQLLGAEQICIHDNNLEYKTPNKINFHGIYPRDAKRQIWTWTGEKENIKIGVSVDKAPEHIARDLQRRFLPTYLEHLRVITKKINKKNEYNSKKEATLRQVADRFGYEIGDNNQEGILYPHGLGIYSIRAYTDMQVELSQIYCSSEAAIKIIEILMAEGRKR